MHLSNISNVRQYKQEQEKSEKQKNQTVPPSEQKPISPQGPDSFERSIKSQIEEMEQQRKEALKENYPKENPWENLFPDTVADELARSKDISAKLAPIINKLYSGKPLTPAEKSFIQKQDPQLAMTAQRVEREVQQLRDKIKRSKSKEQKKKIVAEKRLQLLNCTKRDPFPLFMTPAIDEVVRTMR